MADQNISLDSSWNLMAPWAFEMLNESA